MPLQSKFGIQHRMSCRECGFIFIRHSDLRDASDIPDMCKDTTIKPKLTPLSGEELHGGKSNNSNDARIDIKTRGFLERGQRVFFNKGFRPQHLYRNISLQQCHVMNKKEKKERTKKEPYK